MRPREENKSLTHIQPECQKNRENLLDIVFEKVMATNFSVIAQRHELSDLGNTMKPSNI